MYEQVVLFMRDGGDDYGDGGGLGSDSSRAADNLIE